MLFCALPPHLTTDQSNELGFQLRQLTKPHVCIPTSQRFWFLASTYHRGCGKDQPFPSCQFIQIFVSLYWIRVPLTRKHTKHDPLINIIQNNGWRTNPLITMIVGVRGAIHEHSIKKLTNLNIPTSNIKPLQKKYTTKRHQITHLVLNRRKLDNKQTPPTPPPMNMG